PRDFMAGLVCQIERSVHALRETFDLDAAPSGNDAPAWLTEPEPEINRPEGMQ
ncbi:hypothetical protein K0M08_005588, partial [Escherichia coli]|nr:hypothetical protein [Escherichia coli]